MTSSLENKFFEIHTFFSKFFIHQDINTNFELVEYFWDKKSTKEKLECLIQDFEEMEKYRNNIKNYQSDTTPFMLEEVNQYVEFFSWLNKNRKDTNNFLSFKEIIQKIFVNGGKRTSGERYYHSDLIIKKFYDISDNVFDFFFKQIFEFSQNKIFDYWTRVIFGQKKEIFIEKKVKQTKFFVFFENENIINAF